MTEPTPPHINVQVRLDGIQREDDLRQESALALQEERQLHEAALGEVRGWWGRGGVALQEERQLHEAALGEVRAEGREGAALQGGGAP